MPLKVGQLVEQVRTFALQDFERFAILSGDNNPIHVDPVFAAGTRFGKPVAHGMLLYSALCAVLHNDLLPEGAVQLEQELMFPTPTYAGEAARIRLQVTGLQADSGLANISMEISRPNGEAGCLGSTLVSLPGRGQAYTSSLAAEGQPPFDADSMRGLKLGQRASKQRSFSAADIDEYISISRDLDPLITSAAFAREAGLDERLLPAGLLGGMISDLLGTELPGRGTNWLKQHFRFLAPAYPGEQIVASAEIIRLRPEKDLVNLRTSCSSVNGKLICDGEALVLVKDLVIK